jgi:hypothetical protein
MLMKIYLKTTSIKIICKNKSKTMGLLFYQKVEVDKPVKEVTQVL